MARDKENQSQLELEEGNEFNDQLRKQVDTLQEDLGDITKLISKLGDLANTLQKESNAVRDAINKQLQQESDAGQDREEAESKTKLREDVDTLQNEYIAGRKREEALNI